jgi:repressor LexA
VQRWGVIGNTPKEFDPRQGGSLIEDAGQPGDYLFIIDKSPIEGSVKPTRTYRYLDPAELERVVIERGRRHAARLHELQNQQQKLLHLHYRGTVDEEVLASEQQRIGRERADARKWADAATHDAGEIMQALDEALTLLTDTQIAYAQATPHTRRLLNQALFAALLILDDWVVESEQTPWVAALHRLAQTATRPSPGGQGSAEPQQTRQNDRDPHKGGRGLNDYKLVRPSGLEPPRTVKSTRPSTLRVYQFRHGRRGASISPASPPRTGGIDRCLYPSTADATVRTHVRRRPQSTRTGGRQAMDLTKRQQEIFDFIRKYSAKYGYPPTVRDIGKAVGLASSSTVHAHLANLEKIGLLRRDPSKPRAIELLDRAVGSAVESVRGMVRAEGLPVVGSVAAGEPILAEENIEEYVAVPEIAGGQDGEYLLRIRGDSMKDAGMLEGDYVVVRPQDTAQDGDVVVALLGEEATVKRFFREVDHVRLQPENDAMEPIRSKEVKVLGRVVGLLRSV